MLLKHRWDIEWDFSPQRCHQLHTNCWRILDLWMGFAANKSSIYTEDHRFSSWWFGKSNVAAVGDTTEAYF
jgi:hypothetical protein